MRKVTVPLFLLACFVLSAFAFIPGTGVFIASNGSVTFISKAPLETIKAESKKLGGALDVEKRTFAFVLPVSSFEGFNSPLQKEHFNENYLETDKIPKAIFKGKIIEEVDLANPGAYTIRAKGTMSIHGVDKEMIIKSKVTTTSNQMAVESSFTIALKDFNINIPKLVNQKIAEDIFVDVKMDLSPKK